MPRSEYRLADGTPVPGVTTICRLLSSDGALIHWAWKLGTEGKDHAIERDAAAAVGTFTHLHGEPIDPAALVWRIEWVPLTAEQAWKDPSGGVGRGANKGSDADPPSRVAAPPCSTADSAIPADGENST